MLTSPAAVSTRALLVVSLFALAPRVAFGDESFCWKKTYGRGVGAVPSTCPNGEQSGALCYPKCKRNFHGVGPVCWANAPRSGSYGRGVGEPMSCPRGQENNAGLCYKPCREGTTGVGPVCWNDCPKQLPFNCGAGCAASQADCVGHVVNMVAAPSEVVATVVLAVATGGSSTAATVALRAAATGGKVAVKTGGKALVKTAFSASGRAAAKASAKALLKQRAKAMGKQMAEDTLNSAANALVSLKEEGVLDWKDLDPTGVANVVDAFAKPLCQ